MTTTMILTLLVSPVEIADTAMLDLTFDADANTNGGSIFRECTSSSSLLPPSPAHW